MPDSQSLQRLLKCVFKKKHHWNTNYINKTIKIKYIFILIVTLCTTEKMGKWTFLGPLTLKIKQTPHKLASYQFWVSSHIKYVHKWFICLKTWIHPKFCLYTWFTDNSNSFGSKYSLQCSTCFHYRLLFVYFYTCCILFFYIQFICL